MSELNQTINRWITPRMPILIVCMLVLGLAFPAQVGLLCPYVSLMMVFLTFASSLDGSFRDLLQVLTHPKPVLVTMLALHVLMPLFALGIGTLCCPDSPLYTLSLVLEESSPAAVSSLVWVTIGGGSVELCLSVVLLDTLLSPIILPLTLRLLCGSVVELDSAGMIRDLLWMIVLPAALAMLLCQICGKNKTSRAKSHLSSLTKVVMLLIIGANVTRCVPLLKKFDAELILLLVLTPLMRALGLLLGWVLARLFHFSYANTLTVTLNSSMRNNAAAGTLAAQYFPAEVAFSPSMSPVFSQLFISLTVRVFQRFRPAEDTPPGSSAH